jgi:transposase
MTKNDGRKLSHEALEALRMLAIRRVEAGEVPSEVMRSFGFSRTSIYRWLRKAKAKGVESLRAVKATGRPSGLTQEQKGEVASWITGKDPRQYGFDFGLWTRQIIARMIEERFGIPVSVSTVGRLLADLGITPQKPVRRAYERDPEAVEAWMKESFPKIRSRAKARGADIFFMDEAGVRSDSVLGRSWAPAGKTPVVRSTGKRQSVNAISALTSRGAFWFDVFEGRLTGQRFVELLSKFMQRRRKPVILILDNHPAHRARVVAEFVQQLEGALEIFFLPGYAPDLNPDEFVWQHLKTNGIRKKPLAQNESLRERITRDLRAIQRNIGLVRSFFGAPSVAYVLHS